MIAGLPLAFAQPLVLLGLLTLPVLWWLLRLMPPRPQRVFFPPTRLLLEIAPKEETPARTPWWLTLLRLLLAALLILAAAGPLWNPPLTTESRSAPLAILLDDGWSAAATWDARLRTGEELIARAEVDNRGVAIIPLSETARDVTIEPAGAALVRLRQVQPKPHAVQRTDGLGPLTRFLAGAPSAELVWLSDGVDTGRAAEFVAELAKVTGERPLTIVEAGLKPSLALTAADNAANGLTVQVLRARTGTAENGTVRALDLKGLSLGEATFAFAADAREAEARFDLPVEIRNDIARLEIAGERSAGAVQLLDKRWRRRTIGVLTGTSTETAQPLLAGTYYLSRALSPFADVRLAEPGSPADAVRRFVEQGLPMMILADVGNIPGEANARLRAWIEGGGILVRFAGPRLAAADDDLVPVRLRRGGRTLGGSLSWEQPQALTNFPRESPFFGMPVPSDVSVTRQVLAEPDVGLVDRTWTALTDGTPLVTAAPRGKGMIVLFHITADTRWSDLPLSGSFVDMLKRIVALAGTGEASEAANNAQSREVIAPTRVLDGFGAFTSPSGSVRPVPSGYVGRATADHPPGFYGPPEGLVALNTLVAADRLAPIDYSPLRARMEAYRSSEPHDLRGPMFLAALAMLLLDALLVLWLAGGFRRLVTRRAPAAASIAALAVLTLAATMIPAAAQENEFALKSTNETRLAYVVTGDAEVDAVSKAGLQGLTLFLGQRTALEAGDPIGIDPARDELAFFPIVYWPMVPNAARPSGEALSRIDAYMKQGGTVLFDTRDAGLAPPGPGNENRGPGMAALRTILNGLDVPELEPVPRDHVLTKTFFLLRDFPGRHSSGQLWVEAMPPQSEEEEGTPRPARGGDGVSSILITSNDLAGAWATRPDGQPMLPLISSEPRQREYAFRAGVNIVMYTLTGNYKADQVHVPALLERLGQ